MITRQTPRRRPRHLEDAIQKRCVEWFSLQFPSLAMLLHHSPNGGKRNASEGAKFKAMGTRAGFPDLVLHYPANGYHALFVEMKTKTGTQQPSQKAYEALVTRYGYKYVICRSLDDFRAEVIKYLAKKNSPEICV